MANARQQLGEVFAFLVRDGHWDRQYIARRLRISLGDIDAMERGIRVPTGDEWKSLMARYANVLARHRDLWLRARAERDAEREAIERSMKLMNGTRRETDPGGLVSSLGDKLRVVTQTPSSPLPSADQPPKPAERAPTPAQRHLGIGSLGVTSDGRRRNPPRPPGSGKEGAIRERMTFARSILIQRPRIKIEGDDGICALLRTRFGIGLSPAKIAEVRAEIAADALHVDQQRALAAQPRQQPPQPPAQPLAAQPVVAATREVDADDLGAAVSLILGAVPNLQQLTITVDDNGEASVDYQIREVRIQTTGGSLKVRR